MLVARGNTFREGFATLRIQFRTIIALVTAFAGIAVGFAPVIPANSSAIRFNEVESNGGTPGDRVELLNPGTAAVDRRSQGQLGCLR